MTLIIHDRSPHAVMKRIYDAYRMAIARIQDLARDAVKRKRSKVGHGLPQTAWFDDALLHHLEYGFQV